MNKKLETAMLECAENEWLNPDSDIDWKGIVGHDFTAAFNLGFKKCYELMAEREARLAKELRNCISVIDETSDLSQNTVDTLVKQSNDVLKDLG